MSPLMSMEKWLLKIGESSKSVKSNFNLSWRVSICVITKQLLNQWSRILILSWRVSICLITKQLLNQATTQYTASWKYFWSLTELGTERNANFYLHFLV